MSSHEGLALVLDTKDYRETSSLVRVLTENEGRISLVAKGLRKGKGGTGPASVQPFSLVRVRYFLKDGATLGNLANVELEKAYPAARTSLEAYALISYWFELLKESSQPRDAGVRIFSLSLEFLDNQEQKPGLSLEFLMELSLLCSAIGFGVSWRECVGCGREIVGGSSRFSIRSGGVLCDNCVNRGLEGLMLRPEEVGITQALAWGPDGQTKMTERMASGAADSGIMGVLGLLHRHLVFHLEHPLKTFAFVESIFSR